MSVITGVMLFLVIPGPMAQLAAAAFPFATFAWQPLGALVGTAPRRRPAHSSPPASPPAAMRRAQQALAATGLAATIAAGVVFTVWAAYWGLLGL